LGISLGGYHDQAMDDVVRNRLCDLERHRLTFEMNFANLKNALLHWQTFEAEYECLKEIISSLPSDATEKGMVCKRLVSIAKSLG